MCINLNIKVLAERLAETQTTQARSTKTLAIHLFLNGASGLNNFMHTLRFGTFRCVCVVSVCVCVCVIKCVSNLYTEVISLQSDSDWIWLNSNIVKSWFKWKSTTAYYAAQWRTVSLYQLWIALKPPLTLTLTLTLTHSPSHTHSLKVAVRLTDSHQQKREDLKKQISVTANF